MPWLLLAKNVFAHPIRTFLTIGSLVIATFLICFLRATVTGLEAGVSAASTDRLMVQSAVSLFVDLPVNYQKKIEAVEGVERTCKLQWFGGIYRDPSNFFAQFAVDHDKFFDAYPEVELVSGSKEDFTKSRTACFVGKELARRFGWKVGSKIPLQGTIYPRVDGGPWELEVVGIYASTSSNVDQQTLWFRFDFLDETLESGEATGPRGVGVYVLDLEPGSTVERVSREVDELFANGPQRVQTTTEAEFQRQFVSMFGNVSGLLTTIGGGVLFAILLAVLNTMLLASREHTKSLGVLKALGFTNGVAAFLLMAESLLLCALGGGLGVGLALMASPGIASAMSAMIPGFAISGEIAAMGMGLALGVGLIAGIIPAYRAQRLEVVDALRSEG